MSEQDITKEQLMELRALSLKYKSQEEELQRVKEELATQAWGITKTSEAIKILYKELEKKNNELKRFDQMKSDFVSTVSHELRTPLAIIREGISQILDGIHGEVNEKQKKMLTTGMNNIDRLARLIDNLLDISKIEEGKIELKRELVDIGALAKEIVSHFQSQAKDKGLELKVNLPQEKLELYLDKDKITQVFTNLIHNALKFTDQGYIEILVLDKEDSVECSVLDTGRGISEDNLPDVFGKFQQFERTPGPGEKGTGLGLAIAKAIVELHKGKIWVETKLNQGSKFSFSLPKYSAKELFKESITNGVKEAIARGVPVSIIIFDIQNFASLKQGLGLNRISSIVHNLEVLVRTSLRRKLDAVIKDQHIILVLLPETKKEDALMVAGRLRQAFEEYLLHERLDMLVEFSPKIVTFPGDANTEEELSRKICLIA